ncbi:MAG: ABC transporter permease [Longimicrobiales bacterium]
MAKPTTPGPSPRGDSPNPPEHAFIRGALRLLRPLAPPGLRDRWHREWEGELFHLVRGGGASPRVSWLLLIAARDALHLRTIRNRAALGGPTSPPKHPRNPPMLSATLQDLRFSFRTLRTAPWFSLVTVLTLALGIGASVAMFGVLDAVFLRPLPFSEPDRLVVGRATFHGELNPWVAGADYYDYRNESDAFEELAAILPFTLEMTLSGQGEADRISANLASSNLFPALRVQPVLGRGFRPEEGLEGAEDVVLLSHAFWQNRLRGDTAALGTVLMLDGDPYTIIGILPPDFFFMTPTDLWLPMRPDRDAASSRGNHNWYLVGRLKPAVGLDQAQAGVDVISARLQEAYPQSNADKGLLLSGLHQVLTEDYRLSLWLLSGAVALILLIACGNGAGILLARAPTRQFELSVRAAMGAPQGRLVRQLLAESLALSMAAGALGIALALWLQRWMLEYLHLERLGLEDPRISLVSIGAAIGFSLLAGLLAGTYPALRGSGVSTTDGLKTGGRRIGDAGAGFRSVLVVGQVALSVILLVGSGLLVRSLSNLQALDPGFDSRGLLTAEVRLPAGRYPDTPSRGRFFSALLDEVRALPGIQSAALTSHLPIGDFGNIYRVAVLGREVEPVRVFLRSVSPGYFASLGIPLLSGRGVETEDEAGNTNVVVLSQTAARRLFPDEEPLGRLVDGPSGPMEVVGVVGDVRLSRLEEEPEAALYVPFVQRARTVMSLVLETGVSAQSLAGTLRERLRAADPEVPLSRVATLESLVADSMAERRVITVSLTLLAFFPLLLAAVGLFAILAYHVSRRRHEMGVRMALGGGTAQVGGMVLGQGLRMVSVGILLGLGGAALGTRLLRGLLFGVATMDAVTFLTVTGLILAVTVLACTVPAWRAVHTDPRVVLQAE